MLEKVAFGSNFRNWDFDGFHVLKSPGSENYILNGWPLRICVHIISTTEKQTITDNKS